MMRLLHVREPMLEFGGGRRHVDVRFGLMDHGPFDHQPGVAAPPIRLGLVGSAETVGGMLAWLERCRDGIPAKQSRQPRLFPEFPGTRADGPLHREFTCDREHQRPIPAPQMRRILAGKTQVAVIEEAVAVFLSEIRALADGNVPPQVILCALPADLVAALTGVSEGKGGEGDEAEDHGDAGNAPNFRGALKAACLELRVPIQIVWPTTWDPKANIPRKLKKDSRRVVQDDATRAWNLFTALYYKAQGLPWRLVRDPGKLKASFIGVSFYRSLDGERLYTSTAQMFDERGEGLILRGGKAAESKRDRRPHLTEEGAHSLLSRSLASFRETHRHFPARVVMHKTSDFDEAEMAGFQAAIAEKGVDCADFMVVSRSSTRLFRNGSYPPLRGTALELSADEMVLYTRGTVDFFSTYPGMYVPAPLLLKCREQVEPLESLAEEILALTKMNWNNTQFDGAVPITVRAARNVGDILKYVPEGSPIAPRYSFYM
jgi:hypothetical protein